MDWVAVAVPRRPTNDAPAAGVSRNRTLGRRATESDFLTTNDTTTEPQLPSSDRSNEVILALASPHRARPTRFTTNTPTSHHRNISSARRISISIHTQYTPPSLSTYSICQLSHSPPVNCHNVTSTRVYVASSYRPTRLAGDTCSSPA